MTNYDPITIDAIRRAAVLETYRALLERGGLTYRGVAMVRARLDPESREFRPSGDVEDVRLLADVAMADLLEVPLSDLPGRSGLDHPPAEWLS